LNILKRNLVRESEDDDEDREKYALSLSILNFLKASSDADMMKRYFKGDQKVKEFKEILQNEDIHSSKTIKTAPVDIENSYIGRSMKCLIDSLSG